MLVGCSFLQLKCAGSGVYVVASVSLDGVYYFCVVISTDHTAVRVNRSQ